ncbi:MAG TPA: hypothetical protein VFV49_04165 [Thermoanaerobaculia bacterium]|nr:hypothetical protein [Thermoanaerobaculia bacterium]
MSVLLLGLFVAATTGALVPRSAIPVPAAIGRYVADVAWESPDAVLLATDQGVYRYSLRTRASERLVSEVPLPDGLPTPEAVASDGATLAATSQLTVGSYAMRLADRKRLSAMRVTLLPLDVDVRGQRMCLLAFEMKEETKDAVWCGAVGESWLKYKPVHRLTSGETSFRHAITFNRSSAIALAEDGSLFVVTSTEPGVFHYAPDGKLIETSGRSFDELVFLPTRDMRLRFAGDVVGRYRLLLNTQPLIEDLVLTPRGPAIVVRTVVKEQVRWELWWPRSDGRTVPPTPLGIDRIGPYGHLQCDARGAALACVGSLPDRKRAADFQVSEFVPYLWIFELPK